MTSRRAWILALGALVVTAGTALAYPKPSTVPTRWELEFSAGPLRLYVDEVGGQAYWHFTYKVVNRTGRERVWAPRFTLFTDVGEIMVSGRGVPTRVTDALMDLLGNPLLENQNAVIGELFHGREHAREGLVVWPAGSVAVNELSLFVAGISGETAAITNPITGEELVLRKTLKRDYLVPGDALPRGSTPAGLVGQSWVMR